MEPIRCFKGNAEPHTPFWKMVNAADSPSGEPELEFDGPISEYVWWGDEITPKMFKDDLNRLGGGGPITIRVHSPGGDPFAASLMRAALAAYPGHKTMIVTGYAASAAVAFVMAGDTIKIMDTAQMMIHEAAFELLWGRLDVTYLEQLAAELKVTNASLRDVYAAQTGLSPARVERMMAATTWMSANEAVSLGFADEVILGGKTRINREQAAQLKSYPNVPATLLALADAEEVEEADATPSEDSAPAETTQPPAATPAPEPEGAVPTELAKRKARLEILTQP